MKKSIYYYYFSTIIICLFLAPDIFSTIGGSPGAKTGSPMDGNNCTVCHSGTVNSGLGALSVATNIPMQGYTPGQTYQITVNIVQSAINRFGFEITCEEGNFGSQKVGAFGILDASTTKLINNNTAITHTQGGVFGSGSRSWSVNWTAPTTSVSGGIVFYVSAMSANGNGNNNGDEVYTQSRSFVEASSSVSEIKNKIITFVNPISKDIMINTLEPITISNLKIYDISGKLITENNDLQLPSAINVNFLDAGIYIVNMNLKNGESISEKLMIP
ncbi:MAG: choice-of-anchor V domain-containing protein [Bacteroidota bacterium]|nr:choice-of-anchor V domain-containing protein [Bacteroidota bacterium]